MRNAHDGGAAATASSHSINLMLRLKQLIIKVDLYSKLENLLLGKKNLERLQISVWRQVFRRQVFGGQASGDVEHFPKAKVLHTH